MIGVWVENKKLDLFKDESINLTSKIADIEKLSNVYMDFTQGFTVPANENNNDILRHYYDMTMDDGYGNIQRINAFIEINAIPFRGGKIQIDGATKKDGKVVDYKITFYSDTIQLTELFGEDTLDMLDLSEYDFDWDLNNFRDGMSKQNFMNGDVYIPFICYPTTDDEDTGKFSRIWEIGNAVGGYTMSDITTDDYSIRQDEVRPALRMYNILEAIEEKYDIEFTRDFFDMPDFYELFMWLNERDVIKLTEFDITNYTSFSGTGLNYSGPGVEGNFEIINGVIFYGRRLIGRNIVDPPIPGDYEKFILEIEYTITPKAGYENVQYDLFTQDIDGTQKSQRLNRVGTGNIKAWWISEGQTQGLPPTKIETCKLVISPTQNFECDVTARVYYYIMNDEQTGPYPQTLTDITGYSNDLTFTQVVVIKENIPKMKVIDFLQGVMKMFKLVISPININRFYIDTINNFYDTTESVNLTPFMDQGEVRINRPDLFNNIEFKYEQNDNIQNKAYREEISPTPGLDYGDLKFTTDIEGGKKLEVQLPFSNLLFERMTILNDPFEGEYFPVVSGNSAELNKGDNSISPVKMKPVIFYKTGIINLNRNIKINFFGQVATLGTLMSSNTSNNLTSENVSNTLSYLATGDPAHDGIINRTMYINYWDDWINEIYDRKQRKVSLSGYLDLETILKLKLNNRIILNDVRFKINDFKVNLTTSKVDFTLFKDVFENKEYDIQNSYIDGYGDSAIFNKIRKRYKLIIEVDRGVVWSLTKTNSGYGTAWTTLSETSGVGPKEIWLEVSNNTGSLRLMGVVINTNSGNKNISIVQF